MKKIIGRTDKADFPKLHLTEIEIKVDTGAYTSAIHSHEIEEVIENGIKKIKFILLDPSHPDYNKKKFIIRNYNRKTIKNSFGHSEKRFAIQTEIRLFGQTFPIELTLSERGEMKYPVLLGRKFLDHKFVVDTSKKDISFKSKNKTK